MAVGAVDLSGMRCTLCCVLCMLDDAARRLFAAVGAWWATRQDLCWFSNSSLHRIGFVVASIPDLPVRVDLAACFAVFDGAFLVVGLVSLLK
jgi:hypothetical protein